MLDPWFKQAYPLKHLKKSLYWLWGEHRVLRQSAGVCFTCEEERLLARRSFSPYKVNEKVVSFGTAGPPADSEPVEQCRAFLSMVPQVAERRFLLFLSRIHAKKGCDLLIEAFARITADDPELLLVMAGPDQTGWQRELEALAARLGISDRIIWTGMLFGDAKWGAFRLAEAFVLPSHQENFGIAVAEALACSLPVLISNRVNIWNEIIADEAGLVAPDTLDGTIRLLEQWQGMSAEQRAAMAENARRCFSQRFEVQRAAAQLIATLMHQTGSVPASGATQTVL
jgi:glycosyltransferase involved in cell wall biosynthesis